MIDNEFKELIKKAIRDVRETNPLAPSITNSVTINFVANAQLATGASAAMVYLPDEGETMASISKSLYINMGTQHPCFMETLPRAAKACHEKNNRWVLDPVAVGIGEQRTELLKCFREYKPQIIRGNASEIISLARLWGLDSGNSSSSVRGVDSTDEVDSSRLAATSLALYTGGAVAVSGKTDLVTDGKKVVFVEGGSGFMPMVTGMGCSLGGVCAAYACVADPFVAALTATVLYDVAGKNAENKSRGPASFQQNFIDEIYSLTASGADEFEFTLYEG